MKTSSIYFLTNRNSIAAAADVWQQVGLGAAPAIPAHISRQSAADRADGFFALYHESVLE